MNIVRKHVVASKVVDRILADLSDRAGIGNALDDIDEEVKEEMIDDLRTIVLEELAGADR